MAALTRLVDARKYRDLMLEDPNRCYTEPILESTTQSSGKNLAAVLFGSQRLAPIAEGPYDQHLASPGGKNAVDVRSIHAMEDLGSMMLKLGLNDEGEPCFTISTTNAHVPSTKEQPRSPNTEDLLQDDGSDRFHPVFSNLELRRHLVEQFCTHFNRFHQVLCPSEVRTIIQQDLSFYSDDMLFRNLALLAIGSMYSDSSDAADLCQFAANNAEGLILRCLKFCATPLVVQGLTLLSWLHLMLGNDMASWNFNCELYWIVLKGESGP